MVVVLLLNAVQLKASIDLDVRIFSGYSLTSLDVTPIIGKYSIYNNDVMMSNVLKEETLHIVIERDSIKVTKGGEVLGMFETLTLTGEGLINSFRIKPYGANVKEREYDDGLMLAVQGGNLLIINHVNVEHYVAGVVQAEGGGSVKEDEFYIVQAICCRTYALNNARKHAKEGFNLCDDVHCQAYLGRCRNPDIQTAVSKTANDVIVDQNGKMISAAFHSNSGGETMNSEDVWTIATPYLKSVEDPFSLGMPNATWEKVMPVEEWLSYLNKRFNYPIQNDDKKELALNFYQDHRQAYFRDSIRLTEIRADLGLRSTFFDIVKRGDEVVFKGRGYGHGVGLSQEGAIEMARQGYNYRDIIKFYYKNVEIMSYEQVMIMNY